MNSFVKGARLCALPLALAAAWPALAQSVALASPADEPALRETVIAATRVAQPLSDLLADVSIVDRETIERQGLTDLASLLGQQPGVQVVRTGGLGASTSVFLRGASSQHTAVFLDGVRVDSQSGSGGMDWQTIPVSIIDRVEVLRGPAAAVYGSDAIGGVIQIFTRKGEAGFQPHVGLGVGNRGTVKAEAGLRGAQGAWDYALGMQTERTDGFNASTKPGANPDDDGYRLHSMNARLGFKIHQDHRLELTALSSQSNSGYDTSAMDDRSKRSLKTLGLAWAAQWNAHYSTRVSVSQSDDLYQTVTLPKNSSLTETQVRSYLLQNEWRQGIHVLSANLERREDTLENKALDRRQRNRSQNALALGWGLHGTVHSLQLNARHDSDSEFGGKNSGSAAYGYAITPAWRATAAVGTSFRVPTLYQRFHSTYGRPDLKAEEGRNMELGLRWSQGSDSFSAVAYRNRLKNLLEYRSEGPSGRYMNVAQAELQGVTLAASTQWAGVRWGGSVDFQNPRDREDGKRLARRAKRFASLNAQTAWAGWQWQGEVQTTSSRFDKADNKLQFGGYTLFNLSASRPITRDLTVVARVDNLLDKDYTVAKDYATVGRSVYVGLKWAPVR